MVFAARKYDAAWIPAKNRNPQKLIGAKDILKAEIAGQS
jgi:hypothetical protein